MILDYFKKPDTTNRVKPRDLVEFDRARATQRKALQQVDAAADVLSKLVRSMKGPEPVPQQPSRSRRAKT